MFLLFVNNNDENRHEMNNHKRLNFFLKFEININVRERFRYDFFNDI